MLTNVGRWFYSFKKQLIEQSFDIISEGTSCRGTKNKAQATRQAAHAWLTLFIARLQ